MRSPSSPYCRSKTRKPAWGEGGRSKNNKLHHIFLPPQKVSRHNVSNQSVIRPFWRMPQALSLTNQCSPLGRLRSHGSQRGARFGESAFGRAWFVLLSLGRWSIEAQQCRNQSVRLIHVARLIFPSSLHVPLGPQRQVPQRRAAPLSHVVRLVPNCIAAATVHTSPQRRSRYLPPESIQLWLARIVFGGCRNPLP